MSNFNVNENLSNPKLLPPRQKANSSEYVDLNKVANLNEFKQILNFHPVIIGKSAVDISSNAEVQSVKENQVSAVTFDQIGDQKFSRIINFNIEDLFQYFKSGEIRIQCSNWEQLLFANNIDMIVNQTKNNEIFGILPKKASESNFELNSEPELLTDDAVSTVASTNNVELNEKVEELTIEMEALIMKVAKLKKKNRKLKAENKAYNKLLKKLNLSAKYLDENNDTENDAINNADQDATKAEFARTVNDQPSDNETVRINSGIAANISAVQANAEQAQAEQAQADSESNVREHTLRMPEVDSLENAIIGQPLSENEKELIAENLKYVFGDEANSFVENNRNRFNNIQSFIVRHQQQKLSIWGAPWRFVTRVCSSEVRKYEADLNAFILDANAINKEFAQYSEHLNSSRKLESLKIEYRNGLYLDQNLRNGMTFNAYHAFRHMLAYRNYQLRLMRLESDFNRKYNANYAENSYLNWASGRK